MAKQAFERSTEQCGMKITHYHADNGQFADNAFVQDCQVNRQSLLYFGMNTRFQNGIAEHRIRDLQERTQTSMLYAMHKWKKMVIINLSLYAMRHANDVANAMPRKGKEISPLELFSGVQIAPKLCHFNMFRCPMYVLDNALQSGQGAPKWKKQSRLGVYLGPSPNHACSIALVLNPQTGHVSPQFHTKFDDFFEMVQDKSTDLNVPDPKWQYLSGFATKKGPTKVGVKGGLDSLLAPCRGATAATIPPKESTKNDCSSDPHQDLPLNLENNDDEPNQPAPLQTVAPAAPPQLQQELPSVAARQTRSGRVINNIPRYDQSVSFVTKNLSLWNFSLVKTNKKTAPWLLHNSPHKRPSKIQLPMQ